MKVPLAVVTMVYNEPDMLPLWERHYHAQVGARHCYILDHGSDDGSTVHVGSNIVRLPRDVADDAQRAVAVSHFCAALFFVYDAVIYVDADELVVADPRSAGTLADYAQKSPRLPCVTVFGLDILHDDRSEASLDKSRKFLAQRRLVRPMDALCKPIFIREPKQWGPGFHRYDEPPVFDDLYLFHLAYADMGIALCRQRKRNMSSPVNGLGEHHRLPPEFLHLHIRELVSAEPKQVDFDDDASKQEVVERPAAALLWLVPEHLKDVV